MSVPPSSTELRVAEDSFKLAGIVTVAHVFARWSAARIAQSVAPHAPTSDPPTSDAPHPTEGS